MVTTIFIFPVICMNYHSSEIRGLCLTKISSETLQNMSYFWHKKSCSKWKTKKQPIWVFLFLKYGKFWSVSHLELFVMHNPWNFDECYVHYISYTIQEWRPEWRTINKQGQNLGIMMTNEKLKMLSGKIPWPLSYITCNKILFNDVRQAESYSLKLLI